MIFTYSFTINGYDVTVIIEFFPHNVVLEDSSPELTNDESEKYIFPLVCKVTNSWRLILFCFTLLLGYFCRNTLTARPFSAETFFTAGLFPADILYCWVILCNMFFNHDDVFAVGIVHGSLLSVPT